MESTKMKYFSSFAILCVIFLAADLPKRCDAADPPECAKYGQNHTLCKYRGENTRCLRIRSNITRITRRSVLVQHNKYRSIVAGGNERRGSPGPQLGAQNMTEVVYDQELGDVAQRYADQCIFGSDVNRNNDKYESVGQNVFSVVADPASLRDTNSTINNLCENAAAAWYNEVAGFNKANVEMPPRYNVSTGRYAQMVQWNVQAVGCGSVLFLNSNGKINGNCICNYGIKKGTNATKLYAAADVSGSNVCSMCGSGDGQGCEDNLCSVPVQNGCF